MGTGLYFSGVFLPVPRPDPPLGTDGGLPRGQCATRQIEIGQRKQGQDLGGVLGQPAIAHFAIAPQMFDDPKGMFDPGADAVALWVERTIGPGQLLAAAGFAKHPPVNALGFGGAWRWARA